MYFNWWDARKRDKKLSQSPMFIHSTDKHAKNI